MKILLVTITLLASLMASQNAIAFANRLYTGMVPPTSLPSLAILYDRPGAQHDFKSYWIRTDSESWGGSAEQAPYGGAAGYPDYQPDWPQSNPQYPYAEGGVNYQQQCEEEPELSTNYITLRVDFPKDFDASIDLFAFVNNFSVRAFNLNSANGDLTDWQIGYVKSFGQCGCPVFRAGVYWSHQSFPDCNNDMLGFYPGSSWGSYQNGFNYIVLYGAVDLPIGCNFRLFGDLNYYIPMDDCAPSIINTTDLFAETYLGCFKLGVGAQYSQIEGTPNIFLAGPRAGFDFCDNMSVNATYFVWRFDDYPVNPNFLRLDLSYCF